MSTSNSKGQKLDSGRYVWNGVVEGRRRKENRERNTSTVLTKFQRTMPSRIIWTVPLILEVPLWTPFEDPSKRIVGYDGSKSPLTDVAPEPKRLELGEMCTEDELLDELPDELLDELLDDVRSGEDIGEDKSTGSRTFRSTSMSRTASVKSSSKKLGLSGPSFSAENWKGMTWV